MEKQPVWKKRSLYSRLLILLILIINSQAFASALSSAQIKSLHVIPQNKIFFTGTECGYVLTLPGIEPSDVQTDLPDIPAGVQFLSSKRDEFIDSTGTRGTTVSLWFSFSDSGTFKLGPLKVLIKMRQYILPFDSVDVYENPKTIQPVLFVKFEKGINQSLDSGSVLTAQAGSKIVFTLYLKYAVQVIGFSWDLPKNSLFTELERYDITRGEPRGNDFSPEAVPVARFEWQPLASGVCRFPDIHLTATSYSGARKEPRLPVYNILITEPAIGSNTSSSDSKSFSEQNLGQTDGRRQNKRSADSFAYAFNESYISDGPAPASFNIDCKKLSELRSAERHSFPWESAAKIRREAEKNAGISPGVSEPSQPIFFIILIICAVFAFCTVVFFILRRFYIAAASAGLCLVFVIFSSLYASALLPSYAVFAGGSVSPIPEKNASSEQSVSAGVRVKVVESAGEWVYIDCADSGGWVPSGSVFKIR